MKSQGEPSLDAASRWWTTRLIDIEPGVIRIAGYPIEQLIGTARFVDMVWLMLRGELPTCGQSALLEAALVAAVDHGPHAPSIAIARMAVSCGLPLNGAMASAINVLDDVHGGAGQQCMQLFHAIMARVEEGDALVSATAAVLQMHTTQHGKVIPGFGHRFHPTDPRAPRLLALVDEAATAGLVTGRYAAIARSIESNLQANTGRRLPMNIDGATATVFAELGFEPPLARGLFILSRSVGVLAHAWEQSREGTRIKGPMPPSIPYRYAGVPPRTVQRRPKASPTDCGS